MDTEQSHKVLAETSHPERLPSPLVEEAGKLAMNGHEAEKLLMKGMDASPPTLTLLSQTAAQVEPEDMSEQEKEKGAGELANVVTELAGLPKTIPDPVKASNSTEPENMLERQPVMENTPDKPLSADAPEPEPEKLVKSVPEAAGLAEQALHDPVALMQPMGVEQHSKPEEVPAITEEERKMAELKKEGERKMAELEKEEERKMAELKKEEERKMAELEKEEERKMAELEKEEERKKAEIEKEQEKKMEELMKAEERKQEELRKELRKEQERKEAELRKEQEKKMEEIMKAEERKQEELRKEQERKEEELRKEQERKEEELRKEQERKEAELKKKEEEEAMLKKKEEEEAELKKEQERKEAELKKEQERKEAELKKEEERKMAELKKEQEAEPKVEERKEAELKQTEEKEEAEQNEMAKAKESELKETEETKKLDVEEEEKEPAPGSLSFPLLDQEQTKVLLQASRTLVVLRGLPGSGKSRVARAIAENFQDLCSVFCADDHGIKPENPEASADGYKALDEAVVAHCSAQKTAPMVVVVDDTNHTLDRLACLGEIAEQQRLVAVFLEPQTEWSRDLSQLPKKTGRDLKDAQFEAMNGPFEDTILPLYFGWFLTPTTQDKVKCTSMDFLKTLDTLEAFKKHLADFNVEAEKEVDLEQYFQSKGILHCTTKFCDYGKAEGAKEYAEQTAVKELYGSAFELSLSALFVTPRTVGARVSLSEDQLVLWPADAEKEAQPEVPTAASLPLGSRAHITLGCANGVEPVQTGFDLLEILALQQDGQQGELVEEMELGSLAYYGSGRWLLSLREPISVQAIFSSLYNPKKADQTKEKKKKKCTIL